MHYAYTGAMAILETVSIAPRPRGVKPLWLRLEWNCLDLGALECFLKQQQKDRGLVVDLPQVRRVNI